MIRSKITIITMRRPIQLDLNDELQWFGQALGLFGERDRDKSCFRIFIELVKARKTGITLSSDDLADLLHLSRSTVVHHLRTLMQQGMVIQAGRRYTLRADSLEELTRLLQQDAMRAFENVRKMGQQLDHMLGL